MMRSGVYKIRCLINDRCYVGSSVDVVKRLYNHHWHLIHGKHPNQKLQRAWNKHGALNFEFSVVEPCARTDQLVREQHWMDVLDVCVTGYNMSPTARNTAGRKFSAETKAKIGAKSRERNQGATHPMFGRKHSAETRRLISEKNKIEKPWLRKPKSPEHRVRLREAALKRNLAGDRNPYFGRKHSDEIRAKMRGPRKKRMVSPNQPVSGDELHV